MTLCRGALLFPKMPLAMLHNRVNYSRPYDLYIWGLVLKTHQSLVSFTPQSTHLHCSDLQPRSYAIPAETLEPSFCRIRWGCYGIPPTIVPRGNTARPSRLKIYRIKKVQLACPSHSRICGQRGLYDT
jgi:hypothetical protein